HRLWPHFLQNVRMNYVCLHAYLTACRCIRGFTPKVCPLCRQPFTKGRKLHVDAVESNKSVPSVIDAQFRMLLEHIALVSSEASTTEDVSAVVTEVNDWM